LEGRVRIRILNELGHESVELAPEEANRLITVSQGRYFVMDEDTHCMLRELKLEPGQRIALIPKANGG
jgi:D-lyxose ketol-isomerase